MATGYSRSVEGGHDVIYDYCCTPCEGENLNAEALYYCKDCSQLFCEPCKKYHDKFTRGHRVVGRKVVVKWGDVKPVTLSLMCDEHSGKELEMFCEDHDRLCCYTCISVKHRACKKLKPVSEVAKGIKKNQRFKSFLKEAPKTQSGLKHLYDKQENNIKLLQKARREITSILKDMRKQFNQIVDRLEEKSTVEMDKLLTKMKEKIISDKNICTDFHDKIQKFLHNIQNLEQQSDELVFQGYKICCEQVTSAKEILSSMQNLDYKLQFTPDNKMKQYLSSLETLGTFLVTPPDNKMKQYLSSLETFGTFLVTPSGLIDALENKKLTKPLISYDLVYSVVDKKTYNVKTFFNGKTCNISGMCQLPDGQTAIVDLCNSRVKLLSTSTYSVLDTLTLLEYPQDTCHTTGTELAVTVCNWGGRHEIQFVNAGKKKLSRTRTVKLDHECEGIAYHIDQLYVGSHTALYIYNLSGKMIKKLYEDTSDCATANRFSFSDDGSKIYVTNYDNQLVTLDSLGNQLSTLSDPELQDPTGVCVADNGSVFVCGLNSYTILQVDREGRRKMTALATQVYGIYEPRSLCYDRKTHTLLVGQDVSDNVLALKLK